MKFSVRLSRFSQQTPMGVRIGSVRVTRFMATRRPSRGLPPGHGLATAGCDGVLRRGSTNLDRRIQIAGMTVTVQT
jgi:hypothetical protein